MRTQDPSLSSFRGVEGVGVALRRVRENGLHAALVYRVDDFGPQLLHLGWHQMLMSAAAIDENCPYRWAQLAELEREDLRVLANFTHMIATQQPIIPYGLDERGISIDRATGLVTCADGCGLTCATFILIILETYGYFVINKDDWPTGRSEDIEFRNWVIQEIRKTDPSHADAIGERIVSPRFWPEEVIGAASSAGWPHSFVSAQEIAVDIRAEMGL